MTNGAQIWIPNPFEIFYHPYLFIIVAMKISIQCANGIIENAQGLNLTKPSTPTLDKQTQVFDLPINAEWKSATSTTIKDNSVLEEPQNQLFYQYDIFLFASINLLHIITIFKQHERFLIHARCLVHEVLLFEVQVINTFEATCAVNDHILIASYEYFLSSSFIFIDNIFIMEACT